MDTTRDNTADKPAEEELGIRSTILEELHAAESNEASFVKHLHRRYDQKGLLGLRRLKAHIADLKMRLNATPHR